MLKEPIDFNILTSLKIFILLYHFFKNKNGSNFEKLLY